MTFRIKREVIIATFFSIISVIPIFIWADRDCNWYISIISIGQIAIFFFILNKCNIHLFSLPSLFMLMSVFFHFGEAWLLAINRYDLYDYTNIDLARSMETYNYANVFALLVQSFVMLGIAIGSGGEKVENVITNVDEDENQRIRIAFKIGKILVIIGIIPLFLYYYKQIKIIFEGGIYSGIRNSVDLGPAMLLSGFYQPGAYLLLLGSKNNLKRATAILFFEILFELFCMISGNRAQQIIAILMYLFIYFRVLGIKFTFKKGIFSALSGYVMLMILYFISVYRNYSLTNRNELLRRIVKVIRGEPILAFLSQIGANLNVVTLTFVSVPSYHSYNLGMTYIVSWLAIYPNTGGLLGDIPRMYTYLNYLDTDLPLGGSYIGELYFNFGWFGILFASVIGIFLGKISKRIDRLIYEKDLLKLAVYIVMFGKLIWWVRDYFSAWMFSTVWAWIGIYSIKFFFRINDKRKTVKIE